MTLKKILLASWILQLVNVFLFFTIFFGTFMAVVFFLSNIAVCGLIITTFILVMQKKDNLINYRVVIAAQIVGLVFYAVWIIFFILVFSSIAGQQYMDMAAQVQFSLTLISIFLLIVFLGIAFFVLSIIGWIKVNDITATPNWQLAPGFNQQTHPAQNFNQQNYFPPNKQNFQANPINNMGTQSNLNVNLESSNQQDSSHANPASLNQPSNPIQEIQEAQKIPTPNFEN